MTKQEFKQRFLSNAFYWVNKDNFMQLQEILQEFDIICHTGKGFIGWHDGFKNLTTFPPDKFHNFEYYQKSDFFLPDSTYGEVKNYEEMLKYYINLKTQNI